MAPAPVSALIPDRGPLPLTALRYLVRGLLLAVHLFPGLLVPVLPLLLDRLRRLAIPSSLSAAAVGWWSGGLLWIFGLRIRIEGEVAREPVLLVVNHQSWMDIELVHSSCLAQFIAKIEIASWPLVGALAALAGTVFHRRGSADSLRASIETLSDSLLRGRTVAVFPEGGIAAPGEIGIFHPRVLDAAIRAGVPIQPVALFYGFGTAVNPRLASRPGESFFGNFFRVLGEPRMDARLVFLPPIRDLSEPRRQLAERARMLIRDAVGLSAAGMVRD